MKRIYSFFICVLVVFLLFLLAEDMLKEKKTACKMSTYIMNNGIEVAGVSEEYREEGCFTTIQLVEIKGLVNKSIESQINQRIKQKALDMTQNPRGYGEVIENHIFVSIVGNFNNILSVCLRQNVCMMTLEETEPTRTLAVDTMNFDLNSGREIQLGHMFPKGSDYVNLLNEMVSEQLKQNDSQIAFNGLHEDQKFTIGLEGLELYLGDSQGMDQDTLKNNCVVIQNSDLWKIGPFAQRFYDPSENIYVNVGVPSLINWDNLNSTLGGTIINRSVNDLQNVMRYHYPKELPQPILEQVLSLIEDENEQSIRLMHKFEKIMHYPQANYHVNITVFHYGSLYNLSHDKSNNTGDDIRNERINDNIVYDANLNPIRLEFLFKEHYDYEQIIMQEIEQNINESKIFTTEAFYAHMKWYVGTFGLTFWHPAYRDEEGIAINIYIPYSAFGIENMTIFY